MPSKQICQTSNWKCGTVSGKEQICRGEVELGVNSIEVILKGVRSDEVT